MEHVSLLCLALARCGGDAPPAPTSPNDYVLPNRTPFPERADVGERQRTVIVRYEDRAGADRRGTACGITALLFDVSSRFTLVPAGIEGDCRLYVTPPESEYGRQRWVCAGALGVSSGSLSEQLNFCPPEGTAPVFDLTYRTGCRSLAGGATVRVTSADDMVPGDAVTDLDATVALPSAVTITAPTTLPTTTWPEAGNLTVNWQSANATSAVVRVEASGPMAPLIVCDVRRNGAALVPAGLLAQGNFRSRDALLRVTSLRDVFVEAEGGRRYRVAGATASSVLLQGRR